VLSSLPMLEVFRSVSILCDPKKANIERNDERACDILNIYPRMQRIEHWDLGPTHAITLSKEADQVVRRVEVVDDADESFMTHIVPRESRRVLYN
jgi:hypothetical protein